MKENKLAELSMEFSVDIIKPILSFDSEIIEFCYHTGTEIAIDMYIYDKE